MNDRIAAARRLAFLGLTGGALGLVSALAGCSSQGVSPGVGQNGTPTGTAGSGSTAPSGGGATGQPIGMAGATGTPPLTGTCGGVLPASYNAICNACHTQSGSVNARYPDLYQFK